MMGRPSLDLYNKTFGDWAVIKRSESRNQQSYWLCRCVCGVERDVSRSSLISGNSLGCGCNRGKRFSESTRKDDRVEHILNREYKHLIRRHNKISDDNQVISFEEYCNIVDKPCYYCSDVGGKVIADYGRPGNLVTSTSVCVNGIDRIDSDYGYTYHNVLPCCPTCNIAKGKMSVNDFKNWVTKVYHTFCKP